MPCSECYKNETYIGDGLYAASDGYAIRLRAQRKTGNHHVYLDLMVWRNLKEFVARIERDAAKQENDDHAR